jgi:putative endonuclease
MHYTYVLLSRRDARFYTGSTSDLQARLRAHLGGRVRSTAYRAPLALVYYEACLELADAQRRERFLKTGKGKRYLRGRLAGFLARVRPNNLERR